MFISITAAHSCLTLPYIILHISFFSIFLTERNMQENYGYFGTMEKYEQLIISLSLSMYVSFYPVFWYLL